MILQRRFILLLVLVETGRCSARRQHQDEYQRRICYILAVIQLPVEREICVG